MNCLALLPCVLVWHCYWDELAGGQLTESMEFQEAYPAEVCAMPEEEAQSIALLDLGCVTHRVCYDNTADTEYPGPVFGEWNPTVARWEADDIVDDLWDPVCENSDSWYNELMIIECLPESVHLDFVWPFCVEEA